MHPGAAEGCADQVDNDCDGGVDDEDVDCGCASPSIYLGDLTLSSQTTVDYFCTVYDTVYGSLYIDGADITNLDGLSCLCQVTDDLYIEDTLSLVTAELPMLTTVGGNIYLHHNDVLEVVEAPALVEVGGRIDTFLIHENGELTAVRMPALHTVGGKIYLRASGLTEVDFTALTTAGDTISIYETGLAELSLPSLETVAGYVTVWGNTTLASVDLPALREVGDYLHFNGNDAIEHLECPELVDAGGVSLQYNGLVTAAFPSLDSTSESFVLYMNDVLESVSAGGLTVVVVVSLAGCPMLPYVEFPLLEEVTGDVHVTDDFGAYVAFPALTTIGGSLHLEDEQAPGIATSASLPALEILGGLEVADTSSLPEVNLMALSAVDGDVFCSGADGLDAIVLPSLAEVGGNVTLEDLPDLQLLAMDSLVWVSGWIELEGNPSLVSASWPALQSVGGGLFVHRSTTRSTRSLARRWPRSWDPCRYSRRRRSRPSISPRCRRSAVTCGSSTRRASPTSCRSTVWRRSART